MSGKDVLDGQNLSKAFKEYKWYNSHSIPLDVQVGISRLEIPLDLLVNSEDIPNDISITAQIISNQLVLHEAILSTHFAVIDELRNALIFDYAMSFPLKIKDLSINSIITFTAVTPNNKIIGGTTMHFFDKNGSLKRGKQKLIFYFGCEADQNVLPDYSKTSGDLYEKYREWDYSFQMEKFMETYKPLMLSNDGNSKLDWLDRLTLNQVQTTLGHALIRDNNLIANNINDININSNNNSNCYNNIYGLSYEEIDLSSYCCLIIELPLYPQSIPILFEDRTYSTLVVPHTPPTHYSAICSSISSENHELGYLEFAIRPDRPLIAANLQVIADWDIDQDNLSEDMHRRINHNNSLRHNHDPLIKPNLTEKELIDRILRTTANHTMSFEEMDLLYRFRYNLSENKKALIKFLMAIDWTNEIEIQELPILLLNWKEKAPIDVADALKLLGREKYFQNPIIREYAVEILQLASDTELLTYLLQLVQALRYEPTNITMNDNDSLTQINNSNIRSNSNESNSTTTTSQLSPLAKFLIHRGCKSSIVANYLYWYLKVEIEDEVSGHLFQEIFDTFLVQLSISGKTFSSFIDSCLFYFVLLILFD